MVGKVVFGNGRTQKDRYFADGKEVSKKEYDELFPSRGKEVLTTRVPQSTIASSHKAWPRLSDAAGVHPSQKAEAEADAKKRGVPTEFSATDGRAIFRDSAHQRDFQKAYKMHNRDGGYGQVCG